MKSMPVKTVGITCSVNNNSHRILRGSVHQAALASTMQWKKLSFEITENRNERLATAAKAKKEKRNSKKENE